MIGKLVGSDDDATNPSVIIDSEIAGDCDSLVSIGVMRTVGGTGNHTLTGSGDCQLFCVTSFSTSNLPSYAIANLFIAGIQFRNGNLTTILNSYASSEVSGISSAGGLVGLNFGTLANTHASGSVVAREQGGSLGGDNDMPACDVSGLPDCGDVQIRGLTNLEVAGLVVLRQFVPSRLRYTVAVELGVVSSLRVIPYAAESDAVITIDYNKEQQSTTKSGMPSELIMLDTQASEAIRITVRSTRDIVEYVLELDYFSSNLNRAADADGDGLIEIATLEDLDAIRHSLDGKAYRHQQPSGIFTSTEAGGLATATIPVCSGYELSKDLDFTDAASCRPGVVNRD